MMRIGKAVYVRGVSRHQFRQYSTETQRVTREESKKHGDTMKNQRLGRSETLTKPYLWVIMVSSIYERKC